MKKIYIYLVGVILLGLMYAHLKSALGGGWRFFCIALIYLLVIRFIAERFGKP